MNEKIKQILWDNGLLVEDENEEIEMDSLQYLAVLCDMENSFNIEISEEYLLHQTIKTPADLQTMLNNAGRKKNEAVTL